LAEERLYSDLELIQKEIEQMEMEVSREEYLNQQHGNFRDSTRSGAEPSSLSTSNHNIFCEDVDSMICYMVEMGGAAAYAGCSNRQWMRTRCKLYSS
jgi:OTU domain-containing protein 5